MLLIVYRETLQKNGHTARAKMPEGVSVFYFNVFWQMSAKQSGVRRAALE